MREYKFRGKNKDIGWVYGQLAYDINGNTYIIQEVELDSSYGLEETILFATMWYRVDKETLGQYTGLKDKNEKEIYEGDILELNKDGRIFYGTPDGLLAKKYQLVGFKDGAFMTCRNKHLIDDYDTYLWIISKYSTVAGNIYDNPELLEEGE